MSTLKELSDQVLLNAYSETYRSMAGQRLNAGARELARRVLWGRTLRTADVDETGLVIFSTAVEFSQITRVFSVPLVWPGLTDDWRALARQSVCRLRYDGDIGLPVEGCGPSYSADLGDDGAQVLRVFGHDGRIAVEGYRMPPKMTGDSDRLPLGDGGDDAVVAYARAKIAMHEDDPDQHSVLMGEFDREAKLYASSARPVTDGVAQTPGMWD